MNSLRHRHLVELVVPSQATALSASHAARVGARHCLGGRFGRTMSCKGAYAWSSTTKVIVLLAILLSASSTALAEGNWCSTVAPETDMFSTLSVEHPYPHEMTSAVVRIYVHLLRRSDGTGGITSLQADEQLQWLFEGYAPYGISFLEIGRDEIMFAHYDYLRGNFRQLDPYAHPDRVDIFLGEPYPSNSNHIVGWAWIPGVGEGVPASAIVLGGHTMFNGGIVHEMGHCMGLYHTFESLFGLESPDGSNCADVGDLVCDTAACLGHNNGYLYEPWTDPETCELTSQFFTTWSWYYDPYPYPDPTNYMAYTLSNCYEHFTDGQVDRMFAGFEQIPTMQAFLVPPQPATIARYAIAAESADTTTVFAVEVLPGTDPNSVTVDVSGLNAAGTLTLSDDGEGEDSIAGDRVYTSARFQANVLADTYTVDVTCAIAGGASSQQEVSVEAVANNAKFIDVSAETGALYAQAPQDTTATPYAAVYFAAAPLDSSSAEILLVTVDDDVTQPLFLRRSTVEGGVPQYVDARAPFLGGAIPAARRGASFCDFDNDGDNDFFVCGVDSAVLYENRLDEFEGRFVNVTAAAFGAARSQLAGSLAASWGDYNRDGFLDLVVTTTDYDGPMRLLTEPGSYNSETLVFRNNRAGSFELTGWGASATGNVVPSGCWVDLDRDGDPELVQARMVGEYPIVLDNTGYATGAGDAQLVAGNWATTGVAGGAGSVSVIDYDHDPYPDLLVTEVAAPGRAVILQNDYDGSPGSKSFTPIELAASGSWTGAVVADFDLNGQEDYLLLPRSGEPALYMADAYGTAPTYRDLAYTLGLRSGGVGGAIAGDFNNDHDPDLYLGRLKADQFQYKNVRQNLAGGDEPAAGQKWLAVQLSTTGSSDGGLVGTEVTLTAGSRRWTQHVDGGSGRGGQRPGRLLFGLGDIAQNAVTVVARYPSGERDSVSSVAVNTLVTLEENEAVALKAGTKNDPEPDFDFELQPGSMNWVFKWRSTNVRGDLRRDVVHVQNFHSYPLNSACSIGIDEGDTLDLHWGGPGVGHLVYWDGSLWQHEVRWGGLLCYPGCEHRFSVTSATDAASSAQSSLRVTTPTTLCLPDMEEQ